MKKITMESMILVKGFEVENEITVKCDGIEVTGIMFGDDECFEDDEFFQFIYSDGKIYKVFYDAEETDLDCIDYTEPYRMEVAEASEDYEEDAELDMMFDLTSFTTL